ncbi:MAG: DUF3795 domain-containing protein [Candidatus Thorarchaeota archaeon]|jgi:hypothetical protein
MVSSNIAYCGLDCDACPAKLAKMNDDDDLRTKMQQEWGSDEYPLSMNDINCDGCKTSDGVHFKFCASCSVRKCASEKGVETCAHCDNYGCDILETWLSNAGDESLQRLEKLRAGM